VERVVEVLESLQTTVLEESEGDEPSSFAVNYYGARQDGKWIRRHLLYLAPDYGQHVE
jgi:hypothetical protein